MNSVMYGVSWDWDIEALEGMHRTSGTKLPILLLASISPILETATVIGAASLDAMLAFQLCLLSRLFQSSLKCSFGCYCLPSYPYVLVLVLPSCSVSGIKGLVK